MSSQREGKEVTLGQILNQFEIVTMKNKWPMDVNYEYCSSPSNSDDKKVLLKFNVEPTSKPYDVDILREIELGIVLKLPCYFSKTKIDFEKIQDHFEGVLRDLKFDLETTTCQIAANNLIGELHFVFGLLQ